MRISPGPAAELLDQPPGDLVVGVQQLAPGPIPEPAGRCGRADDVGEQHRGQNAAGLGRPTNAGQELLDQVEGKLGRLPDQRRVGARKLDQLRSREVLGKVAPVLDGNDGVVPPVQDQRWRMNDRQQRTRVDLQDRAQEGLDGSRAGTEAG